MKVDCPITQLALDGLMYHKKINFNSLVIGEDVCAREKKGGNGDMMMLAKNNSYEIVRKSGRWL